MQRLIRVVMAVLIAVATAHGDGQPAPPAVFRGQTVLDAHNAYPEKGLYRDRLYRAISTGLAPLAIEQDLAYDSRFRRSVLSHDAELDGTEPTLEQHFFVALKPLLDAAVATGAKDRWPMFVLHLDFKTNERNHHRAIWDLLASHQSWLMTAPAAAHTETVAAFKPGPLLVLTENGPGQEQNFSEWAAAAGTHLLFGTIPGPALPPDLGDEERARRLVSMPPSQLMPAAKTTYRRWVNFPWAVVEHNGQRLAGAWTAEDRSRLAQIVAHAHQRGLFVRFYTLNGHEPSASRGWSAGYNFGSLEAARARWRAAITAGVDLIATDQYEEFAAVLRERQ